MSPYLLAALIYLGVTAGFYAYLLLTAQPQPEEMEEPTFREAVVVSRERIEREERVADHRARPLRFS